MMAKIYLDLSDDIRFLFEENQISLEEVLTNSGIDHKLTYESPFSLEEDNGRTKNLVVVIVAASTAVLAISFALSEIISTLQRKPHVIEIHNIEEIRDSEGNIVKDVQGRPLLKAVKKYELLEPRREDKIKEFEIHFNIKDGIVIKVRSEEKQSPEKKQNGNS
jgi:hypothetical protein